MHVTILRGGPSSEYERSLRTGALVNRTLRDSHNVIDIFIDPEGQWHRDGLPVSERQVLTHTDLVWNALHGEYGEDGKVQQLLEQFGVPYTGSGALAASSAWRKDLAQQILVDAGMMVPQTILMDSSHNPEEVARQAFRQIGGQYVVKPARGAFSHGVRAVRSYQELPSVLTAMIDWHEHLLLQEAVHGVEVKCLVVDGFRNQEHYVSLPVEIVKGSRFAIHDPSLEDNEYLAPASLTKTEKDLLMQTALRAHRTLGLEGYSSVDMILRRRLARHSLGDGGGVVILEVDALPPLGEPDHIPQALQATGVTLPELIHHITEFSLV
ncbi:MAG TPA: ATP-grasp domain-containing protein [Candidatus Paceibacterota bacterium]